MNVPNAEEIDIFDKILKAASVLILIFFSLLFQISNCFADDVTVEKTFEYGDTLEYDLMAARSGLQVKIRCTINKKSGKTHLRYGGENRISRFSTLEPILVELVAKANELSNSSLHSLVAFEFLNCDDIGIKSVLAFRHHQQWQDYLSESKKRYVKPPNDFVKHTLIRKNVFKDLHGAFDIAGFKLELASIEKVFAFKAEQLSFYADLKTIGIAPDEVYPVPGILGFKLIKK